MSIFDQLVLKIISEQELLMGPVAWLQAEKVQGLRIDRKEKTVSIENIENGVAVDNLVGRFENLFGRAGREVCKEAVSALIADMQPSQVPSSLR